MGFMPEETVYLKTKVSALIIKAKAPTSNL